MSDGAQIAGWYHAEGDDEGTTRYWDGSAWQGEPQEAPNAEDAFPPALALVDPAVRAAGRVIDWLLLSLVLVPLWAAGQADGVGVFLGLGYSWLALFGGILFVWDTLWVGLLGASPGKFILGYRVTNSESGETPGLAMGAMRALHRLVFFIPVAGEVLWLLVGLVSIGMVFTGERHQSAMDKVADTLVTAA